MLVRRDLHAVESLGAGLKGLNFPYTDYADELEELRGITQEELVLRVKQQAEETRTPGLT
jgi:hypothetical protein